MPVSGLAIAEMGVGGLLIWSGVKGTTLAATFKGLTTGSLPSTDTEPISTAEPSDTSSTGSTSDASSGTANQNYLTIGKYLMANGYSAAGAAGVVGCIAGESGGDPEAVEDSADPSSSGEGLIQWTPGSAYHVPVTGNATKDLDAQLPLILSYNDAQGEGLVQMLNAQTNPVDAADFYSQNFERPAVEDSDVRAGVAESVYDELKGSTAAPTPSGTSPLNLGEL
jgi:hypothetical protein